jgi:hypothetical protein
LTDVGAAAAERRPPAGDPARPGEHLLGVLVGEAGASHRRPAAQRCRRGAPGPVRPGVDSGVQPGHYRWQSKPLAGCAQLCQDGGWLPGCAREPAAFPQRGRMDLA